MIEVTNVVIAAMLTIKPASRMMAMTRGQAIEKKFAGIGDLLSIAYRGHSDGILEDPIQCIYEVLLPCNWTEAHV